LESPSDAQLVARASAGDQAAWDTIVERYSPLLWSVARAYRMSDADANDAIQTTWLRLVEHLGSLRTPDRIGAVLATMMRREALRTTRMRQRESLSGHDDFEAAEAVEGQPESALLASERDTQLNIAFSQLPPDCRRLLQLLAASPAPSYAEVSAALGIPIGSIGPTRARCLERLRKRFMLAGVATGSEPRDTALPASTHEHGEEPTFVPPPVIEEARRSYSWRPATAEVAELVSDSALQPSGLISPAGSTTRVLRYRTADLEVVVEVRPSGRERELSGRLEPPQAARVEIHFEGTTRGVRADAEGRFSSGRILGGRTSLRLTLQDGTELATGWVVL
jgi:RNA polymerase sigma factor (sigma-70 family)